MSLPSAAYVQSVTYVHTYVHSVRSDHLFGDWFVLPTVSLPLLPAASELEAFQILVRDKLPKEKQNYSFQSLSDIPALGPA